MIKICIFSIGKLKSGYWKAAAEDYITRIQRKWQIELVHLADGNSSATSEQRIKEEGEKILSALNNSHIPFALDEKGMIVTSRKFAEFVDCYSENKTKYPCFIIGGAYGLSPAVKKRCSAILSLSSMTFPHELAQVLLLEQIYRAQSILMGTPYHHD